VTGARTTTLAAGAPDEGLLDAERSRRARVLAIALPVAAFAMHLAIGRRLAGYGVLDQFNVLFSADPQMVLEAFTEGLGRHRIAHPNLPHFFSFLVRGVAWLVSAASAGHVDAAVVRRALGLLIVPVAAALQSRVLFRLLVRLGRPLAEAALLTALSILSLSTMVFGSVPESFALSGLAITLGFALFLSTKGSEGPRVYWTWIALGVFAAGLTITNVLSIGILFGVRRWFFGRRLGRTIVVALAFVALVAGICVTSHVAINAALHLPLRSISNEGLTYIGYYLTEEPLQRALVFPSAVASALTDGMPKLLPNKLARGEGITWRMTYQYYARSLSLRNIAGWALLGALFFLAFARRGRGGPIVPLARASVGIIAVSWLLHSFWGDEQFLYSQHWHVAVIVLAAGALSHVERSKAAVYPLLGAAVAFVGLNNIATLSKIFARIQQG